MTREQLTNAASLLVFVLMIGLMAGFSTRPQFSAPVTKVNEAAVEIVDAEQDPKGHSRQYREAELAERFDQAIAMLHAKQYEYALKALERVLILAPNMPEAYINIGFAMIGLERYEEARNAFNIAIDIDPYKANAYWGLAVSLEHLEDLEGALGAMRSFIHLSPPNDPFVRKARSALWEWETALKRGPLPEAEQEWIERRSQQWTDKDGPEADMPEQPSLQIQLPNH